MSRLASFRAPSSPSQSPVRAPPGSSPSSPHLSETTYHRKVRAFLHELRAITQRWDDLVLVDGLRAAQSLIDTRTELENDLTYGALVVPKVNLMEKRIMDLDSMLSKLQRQFDRMVTVVEGVESVLYDSHKTKGWKWVQEEPLWCTWTMERFATNISALLPGYYRSLYQMKESVSIIRSHDTSFETSRTILCDWATQPLLQFNGWPDWEDLCTVEVERWESAR